MGILDIIYRVFRSFFLGEFQVKVKMAVRLPHNEKESCGIFSDLLYYLAQGNIFSRAG